VAALLTVCGCSPSHTEAQPKTQKTQSADLRFVAASSGVSENCRTTARAVGYPVPCPTRLPVGLGPNVTDPGGMGGSDKSWRGWVIGSSGTEDQHLVITASPRPLTNYAKLVNGPAWYPNERVRPLAWERINGRRMRAVYVPPATNDGSAFMDHVVLIWTESGHTYGFGFHVGFHNAAGIGRTLHLDKELAQYIELVRS
jgi:hypothetical protein